MTLSSPAWASSSNQPTDRGNIPAWCTPMPWRTSRDSVLPKPELNREASDRRCDAARVQTLTLVNAWGLFQRRGLGEMHNVDGGLASAQQLGDRPCSGGWSRRSGTTAPDAGHRVTAAVGRPVPHRSSAKINRPQGQPTSQGNCARCSSSSGT